MLQWEWPSVWSIESREAVREAVERAIRDAMAKSTNSQIRGTVRVDLPNLGSTPPELVLCGIRELSVERTAIMLKLRYAGDFAVTLRGLEINLDTIGPSGGSEEADGNFALPFFCPLEMTLHDLRLDGLASIEVRQDVREERPLSVGEGANVRSAGGGGGVRPAPRHFSAVDASTNHMRGEGPPPLSLHESSASVVSMGSGASPSVGFGALLGAGGRRAMRRPTSAVMGANTTHTNTPRWISPSQTHHEAANAHTISSSSSFHAGPSSASSAQVGASPSATASTASHKRWSFVEVFALKTAAVEQRRLTIQLFGDPIKHFTVASNFGSMPGVDSSIEGTLRMLLKPAIERIMTEGITITL